LFKKQEFSPVVIGRVGEDRARKAACVFSIQEVRLGREGSGQQTPDVSEEG